MGFDETYVNVKRVNMMPGSERGDMPTWQTDRLGTFVFEGSSRGPSCARAEAMVGPLDQCIATSDIPLTSCVDVSALRRELLGPAEPSWLMLLCGAPMELFDRERVEHLGARPRLVVFREGQENILRDAAENDDVRQRVDHLLSAARWRAASGRNALPFYDAAMRAGFEGLDEPTAVFRAGLAMYRAELDAEADAILREEGGWQAPLYLAAMGEYLDRRGEAAAQRAFDSAFAILQGSRFADPRIAVNVGLALIRSGHVHQGVELAESILDVTERIALYTAGAFALVGCDPDWSREYLRHAESIASSGYTGLDGDARRSRHLRQIAQVSELLESGSGEELFARSYAAATSLLDEEEEMAATAAAAAACGFPQYQRSLSDQRVARSHRREPVARPPIMHPKW